jgi:hypothetical protein
VPPDLFTVADELCATSGSVVGVSHDATLSIEQEPGSSVMDVRSKARRLIVHCFSSNRALFSDTEQ